MATCNCTPSFDVRCRCYINSPSKAAFNRCPVRIFTIYFYIGNNYDLYRLAENNDFSFLKQYLKKKKDRNMAELFFKFYDLDEDVKKLILNLIPHNVNEDENIYQYDIDAANEWTQENSRLFNKYRNDLIELYNYTKPDHN